MPSNRTTSYDVAVLAGVSQSAVSRTFSPNGSVSKKTRERVLAAAKELGFVPNQIAQSLSLGRSRLVGMVVTQYSQQIYPVALKAAVDVLSSAGESLLLQLVDTSQTGDDALFRLLQARVDVIICAADLTEDAVLACKAANVPLTMINRRVCARGIDHVSSNHFEAMQHVAKRIAKRNVDKTLFLDGPANSWVSEQRRKGFLAGCENNNLTPPHVVAGHFSYDGGFNAIQSLGKKATTYEMVISANDPMAIGAMDALRYRLGARVPEDLEVIGHDDTPTGGHAAYELTTLRQQMDKMIEKAIEQGLARRSNPDIDESVFIFESQIVTRKSADI